MIKKLILLVLFTVINTQYTLSLNYPHLLDNLYTNISAVQWDYTDGFYVGFKDKRYRHYFGDFSSYTGQTLSYVI